MTTKELKKLKRDIAISAIIETFFLSLVVMMVACFLIDGIFNDLLASLMSSIDYYNWYLIMANKKVILLIIYIFILLITAFFIIVRKLNCLTTVVENIDKIVSNPEESIKLPINLKIIENALNKIRIGLITSHNKAQEEENKKNDLIMYMAHDLKTPLTSVIGYLTLLEEEKELSKELRSKYTHIALEKSLRVEDLTNQFFEITRYNLHDMPINKTNIDLTILMDQLVEETYPMLQEKNLKISLKKDKSIPYLGDGALLARAFSNLIKNAINYCYQDTTINVQIRKKEDFIILEVKNKGDKIPDYKMDKIFEKFYRISSSRNSKNGGAGLGLSITKEIIELHNGNISVSNPKDDIIFTIKLPI